jgi:hypothetical protein
MEIPSHTAFNTILLPLDIIYLPTLPKMADYMGSTIFLLAVSGMGTAATDTINLLQRIGLLSIQKVNSKRNTSYYTPIINNEIRLLSYCSLEGSILKNRI